MPNQYNFVGDIVQIVFKDRICVIAKVDYDRVSKHSWSPNNKYVNTTYRENNRRISTNLHQFIMNAQKGQIVDHKNLDKNNYTRNNLRFVTAAQNAQNKNKIQNATSAYFGVHFKASTPNKPWIIASCHKKTLGHFDKELHAAYCYDVYAQEEYGTEAKINGVERPEDYVAPRVNNPEYVLINGQKAVGLTVKQNKIHNSYKIQMKVNGLRICKFFQDKEKAIATYLELKSSESKSNNLVPNNCEIQRNENGIAILPWTNNRFVLVDDDIYLQFVSKNLTELDGYPTVCLNKVTMRLHRVVMNAKAGELIDHINGNKENCLRSNLRTATASENSHNKLKRKNLSSIYHNVSKIQYGFRVEVSKDGFRHDAGCYKNEKVAAWAANQLAIQLYGASRAKLKDVELTDYTFVNNRAVPKQNIGDFFKAKKPKNVATINSAVC